MPIATPAKMAKPAVPAEYPQRTIDDFLHS
jgi:hypothetical protein